MKNTFTLKELLATIEFEMKEQIPNLTSFQIMNIAIQVIREFNTKFTNVKKIVEIDSKGKNYIDLPNDFDDYCRIGMMMPDGTIWTYTKNENINTELFLICGEEYTWVESQDVPTEINSNAIPAKEIIIP